VTDDDLVARAREGDTAAFGELVLRHQAAVHRAALAATGSTADADDVAQEAFLLAYRGSQASVARRASRHGC
jgi:RNA polymerase sigma-70 factor, ECF subfamily